MKATTIGTLLLAAGTALAVPGKRAQKDVVISAFSASQNDQQGFVTFSLSDPNYNKAPINANVIWERPGNPPSNARTGDGAYLVRFPEGVDDISTFTLQVQRVNGTSGFSLTVDDAAEDTNWHCHDVDGSQNGKKCHFNGNIVFSPPSPSSSPSPSASPSASPSLTPSASPSPTPSAEPSS
ncbi:hypothetical protein BDV37DRAFT_285829 [Aspergillus pseudonomiae]|uniref:Ser-Thr-rich glycosyl-phosphatidyl-inositol-anchored membrane family-domain-containing protein n=1 Tax=Aspergillus pseudonomiae TaxID=1506151 RepID=A0A5N7D4D2_9EURO|nr:uncharacterized protein BDV37DRAFT_285829 [Aspergillus pseudonomiae]KAE8401272.1 hypothetical protein BDV37DRAFT_285829 [Aspergillus pseudonomiae]